MWNWNNRRYGRSRMSSGKIAIIVVAVICIFGGIWKYKVAYENSAEYLTVTIADKEVHTQYDEDGMSTTYYIVYTHGEEFNVTGEGWSGGKAIYRQLRVNQQYTVLVAGLGIFNRDILSAKHKPRPVKPQPRPQKQLVDLRPENAE